jgi:probable HAF family extracellular repeat protein
MRYRQATAIRALGIVAVLGVLSVQAGAGELPRPAYIAYDTQPIAGSNAGANGLSNLGWASGTSTVASGDTHAALWSPGNVIDLGTLGGASSGVEWPIKNNHGLIVGISETDVADPLAEGGFSCGAFLDLHGHTCLPFLWQNGTLTALPLLGGNNGFATGINSAGSAVGWAETALHDATCIAPQVLQFEAVEWTAGEKRVLPPLPGDSTSAATAINDAGEVVGISGDCDVAVGRFSARHAVLWLNGHPMRLPTLGGEGWNTPMAINNLGTVVGFSDRAGDVVNGKLKANFQAFLWNPRSGIRQLPAVAGDVLSEATGINDFGQIVGTSFPAAGGSRMVLWQNGAVYDVNTLLPPDSPLLVLASGDINDSGEITGFACVVSGNVCGNEVHAFVAILAPPPGEAATRTSGTLLERHVLVPPAVQARMRTLHRPGHMPSLQSLP